MCLESTTKEVTDCNYAEPISVSVRDLTSQRHLKRNDSRASAKLECRLFCFSDVVNNFFFFFFSMPNLRVRSVDGHQILTHVRW